MNRRIKLLILVLLIAILALAAAIASLAMQGKETNSALPDSNNGSGAVSLYVQNGLWGIRTNTGRAITEPLWSNLRVMNDTTLIAREGTGTKRLYGLIDHKGGLLVPYVYSDFAWLEECDLWIAQLEESEAGQTVYHLYNTDSTLCSPTAWNDCEVENGVLTLTAGTTVCTAIHVGNTLVYQSRYSEHSVGTKKLTMQLPQQTLAKLHTVETAAALGDAAAAFLNYLFVSPDTPLDVSLLGSETPSALLVGADYANCRLQTATVTRIVPIDTDGFPTYRVEMQICYSTEEETEIFTAMTLTLAQNANGIFAYTAFSDRRAEIAGSARMGKQMQFPSAFITHTTSSHTRKDLLP